MILFLISKLETFYFSLRLSWNQLRVQVAIPCVHVQQMLCYSLLYPWGMSLFQKNKAWRCSSVARGLSGTCEAWLHPSAGEQWGNRLNLHANTFFQFFHSKLLKAKACLNKSCSISDKEKFFSGKGGICLGSVSRQVIFLDF